MGLHYRHIIHLLMVSMVAFSVSAGRILNAQELVLPDRWTSPLHDVKPLYRTDTLTIRILGDIMMHEKQIINARRADGSYGFDTYFMFIEDEIREADISIANMEFTLAGEPYSGYPAFSAPDPFADYLAGCGFDIFLAANNHIFDKGTEGAERTLQRYRNLGIRFTGLAGSETELADNNPLYIRREGISLALMNLTYGTNLGLQTHWPKTNYIRERTKAAEAFRAAEEGAEMTLVFPHWGTEYALQHSQQQEKDAAWFVENGADMIIGAHPHVIQDCGSINGVPVAYSLGNAVSNMSAENTQLELMATIRIVRESDGDLKMLPLELKYLWCSRPGGYNDSYTVIPVAEFMDRKDEWANTSDYWNMVITYERVKKETGIYE